MFKIHHCPYCSVDTHANISALFLTVRAHGCLIIRLESESVFFLAWALTPLLCFLAMWQKAERVQIHTTSFLVVHSANRKCVTGQRVLQDIPQKESGVCRFTPQIKEPSYIHYIYFLKNLGVLKDLWISNDDFNFSLYFK